MTVQIGARCDVPGCDAWALAADHYGVEVYTRSNDGGTGVGLIDGEHPLPEGWTFPVDEDADPRAGENGDAVFCPEHRGAW